MQHLTHLHHRFESGTVHVNLPLFRRGWLGAIVVLRMRLQTRKQHEGQNNIDQFSHHLLDKSSDNFAGWKETLAIILLCQ